MNKEEFKAKANQTIDEVAAKIDALKAKKESLTEDVKSTYEKSIKDLEERKTDLEKKYHNLEHAVEDKWEESKQAFSSAADSFKEGWSKIATLFS